MKKLFLFAMAVATLSGCSSSEDLELQSEVKAGGEGYVGFSIQLPTTNSSATRANDKFEDGDPVPDEYKVNNATMFIFKGSTEADAKFVSAYAMNVNTFKADGTPTDQCTTEGIVSSKITKPEINSGEKIYAYFMINSNDMINTTAKTIDGNSYDGMTFEQFSKLELSKVGDLTTGMVMTNAPVASNKGGASNPSGATITTLTTLDPNKIYPTQAAAEANPAGDVYMERAAVKVTVTTTSLSGTITTPGESVTYNAASIKWALSNVNTQYYNTRQMKESWLGYHAQGDGSNANIEGTPTAASLYRFVSGSAIHDGIYRTYWGEDVNYDADATFSALGAVDKNPGDNAYTFENTFDVDRQAAKNTTGIAVSATFNNGKSFYTASTYGDNKILQEPTSSVSGEKIQEYIMTYLCNNYSKFKAWYDNNANNRITVTMDNSDATNATVTAVTKATGAEDLPSDFGQTEIKDALNSITFKYYNGGVAYYNVLIKHFGDDETPWKRENHTENSIEGVYKKINTTSLGTTGTPSPEDNYLGRYGVVRNNWYQIEITGIRQIGSPVIVTPSTDPDDNVDNYLSVKIHITPWAVRKQSVIL